MSTTVTVTAAKRFTRTVNVRRPSLKDLIVNKAKYLMDNTSLERKFLDTIDRAPTVSKDGIGYHLVESDMIADGLVAATIKGRIFIRSDFEKVLTDNPQLGDLDSILHRNLKHVEQYLRGDLTGISADSITWKGKKIVISSMTSEEIDELEFVKEAKEFQRKYTAEQVQVESDVKEETE